MIWPAYRTAERPGGWADVVQTRLGCEMGLPKRVVLPAGAHSAKPAKVAARVISVVHNADKPMELPDGEEERLAHAGGELAITRF